MSTGGRGRRGLLSEEVLENPFAFFAGREGGSSRLVAGIPRDRLVEVLGSLLLHSHLAVEKSQLGVAFGGGGIQLDRPEEVPLRLLAEAGVPALHQRQKTVIFLLGLV